MTLGAMPAIPRPFTAVKVRSGWDEEGDKQGARRQVTGQKHYLDGNARASGVVPLSNARAHWWVLADEKRMESESGRYASSGHAAALFQRELYEMQTSRAGVARLQMFGVIFGYQRVVIYVEPEADGGDTVVANTSRTNLLLHGDPLPWAEWAAEFRQKMPEAIQDLMAEVSSSAVSADHRQAIRERLRQIRELLRLSRYRPAPKGNVRVDGDVVSGGRTQRGDEDRDRNGSARGGGSGGRAGNIYALFLTDDGTPADEVRSDPEPEVKWVSIKNGSRAQGDLEDRAAKYLSDQNVLLINADFRVFGDMVERWCGYYPGVPGARHAIEEIVREWFEQQLIEAILGAQSLRSGPMWTVEDLSKVWSEEALTAAVLPRYHVDLAIKRAVGSKLGSVKERV